MRGLAAIACALVRTTSPTYRGHLFYESTLTRNRLSSHVKQPFSRSMSSAPFLEALAHRRTMYDLSNETTIPDSKVIHIVEQAIKNTPSSFNSQTTRAVVLFGSHHLKLWDIAIDDILATRGAEKGKNRIEKTKESFQGAYGTVLFFEDQAAIQAMIERSPAFSDYFPVWSANTAGMVQLTVWTALEAEGLGASLQHFNPGIDEAVQKEFGLASTWALTAQMPFGKPTAPPNPNKTFQALSERVKVFGVE